MSTLNTLGQIAIGQVLLGPYRPPNWGIRPQIYYMTCTLPGLPAASVTSQGTNNAPPVTTTQPATTNAPVTYYFDAVRRAEHTIEAVGTKHPVQVGPAVVDHIYLNPKRNVLDVLMSDSSAPFLIGQYSSGGSKSVSAFQTFEQIQAARVPITLSTRLEVVSNMWLALIHAVEDNTAFNAARITLVFEQIISAQASLQNAISARPNATDTTNEGTKSPQGLSSSEMSQLNSMAGAN